MKKKVHFFQSVNFKIALSFILLLLIAIQIILKKIWIPKLSNCQTR